jgi:hypothetical protein
LRIRSHCGPHHAGGALRTNMADAARCPGVLSPTSLRPSPSSVSGLLVGAENMFTRECRNSDTLTLAAIGRRDPELGRISCRADIWTVSGITYVVGRCGSDQALREPP